MPRATSATSNNVDRNLGILGNPQVQTQAPRRPPAWLGSFLASLASAASWRMATSRDADRCAIDGFALRPGPPLRNGGSSTRSPYCGIGRIVRAATVFKHLGEPMGLVSGPGAERDRSANLRVACPFRRPKRRNHPLARAGVRPLRGLVREHQRPVASPCARRGIGYRYTCDHGRPFACLRRVALLAPYPAHSPIDGSERSSTLRAHECDYMLIRRSAPCSKLEATMTASRRGPYCERPSRASTTAQAIPADSSAVLPLPRATRQGRRLDHPGIEGVANDTDAFPRAGRRRAPRPDRPWETVRPDRYQLR